MTVLALLVVACAPNDPQQHTATPQDTGREDHGLFEPVALAAEADRQRHGATGLAVAVFNSDGVVWSFGTGSRRVNEQVPVTPDTRFRFASILKMMTATAVLQQHERGNLDIHGPVWDVLPEFRVEGFVAESAGLSIIDLTTHRSGLSEHYELTRGPSDDALAEGVDWLTTHGYFMAPPDSFFNYNNMNYALAGRLIEVADGRSYRSVMQDDVFEPLGMTRTLFLGQTVMDQDDDWAEALGTNWTGFSSNEVVIRPNSYDSGFIRPAGLAFSTVTDLSAFGSFLLAGNPAVLGEAEHSRLITPTGPIGERPHEQYAHGLLVWDELVLGDVAYPTPVFGHSGDFPGFTSNLLVLPELDWGVVVLASGEQAHADATIAAALELAPNLPPATTPAPTPPFDLDTLDDFAGLWHDPHTFGTVALYVDEVGLHAVPPTQPVHGRIYGNDLLPLHQDTFQWTLNGYPFTVVGERDASGQPIWLHTRNYVFRRHEGRSTPSQPSRSAGSHSPRATPPPGW